MNDLTELDDSKPSAPVPADELISRHFDEPLPPEDHGRLTRLLHEDPQALLDFVATARLHQALENRAAVLRPVAASGKRKRPLGWRVGMGIGAAAAAALVAGGGWMIFARPEPANPHSGAVVSVRDIGPPPAEEPGKPELSSLKKRIVKVAGAAAPDLSPADLEELLGRYYVNVTPHGLTVPKALEQLKQAITEVNILNRPAINQLRFGIGDSFEPGVEDSVVLTPLVPPMTVKAYLETCGLFQRVTRQPGNVTYQTPGTWFPADNRLITKVFAVPADFLSALPRKSAGAADAVADPFQKPVKGDPKWTAWEAVNEFFVKADEEGATATFSEQSAKLAMRALPATLDRFDARLNSYLAHKTINQIFITSKICSMPRTALPAGFDEKSGLIMSDAEFQIYMRALPQASGVNLLSSPSVIARAGQRSKVEIVKEVPTLEVPEKWENMGLVIEALAQYRSEFIKLEGKVQLGVLGNKVIDEPDLSGKPSYKLNMELPEPLVSDGRVHSFSTEYELWIPNGQTALFTLDVPLQRDLVAVVAITSTQIDAQGQPLNSGSKVDAPAAGAEIPYATPVPDKPGFVISPFQENGMVDVKEIPSGTKVRCPFTGKLFRVP